MLTLEPALFKWLERPSSSSGKQQPVASSPSGERACTVQLAQARLAAAAAATNTSISRGSPQACPQHHDDQVTAMQQGAALKFLVVFDMSLDMSSCSHNPLSAMKRYKACVLLVHHRFLPESCTPLHPPSVHGRQSAVRLGSACEHGWSRRTTPEPLGAAPWQ